jgi:hypothetical protein
LPTEGGLERVITYIKAYLEQQGYPYEEED